MATRCKDQGSIDMSRTIPLGVRVCAAAIPKRPKLFSRYESSMQGVVVTC